MTERVINQQVRKSQFLTNLSPKLRFDELVKDKLESGKFPLTKTGWIKIIAVIVLLAALALFVGQSVCDGTPDWYQFVFPCCIGASIAVQLILYIIFSAGCTIKNPGNWVKADIILNLLFSIVTIVASVLTTTQCTDGGTMHDIPGPVGIAGGVLSIIGCAAIFLMYRYEDETDDVPQTPITRNMDSRKSMHA